MDIIADGTVSAVVNEGDRESLEDGFEIRRAALTSASPASHHWTIPKAHTGERPNTVDIIADGTVSAVVNTIEGDRESLEDGFEIRRAAVDQRIPCFTSLDTARVAVEAS